MDYSLLCAVEKIPKFVRKAVLKNPSLKFVKYEEKVKDEICK